MSKHHPGMCISRYSVCQMLMSRLYRSYYVQASAWYRYVSFFYVCVSTSLTTATAAIGRLCEKCDGKWYVFHACPFIRTRIGWANASFAQPCL